MKEKFGTLTIQGLSFSGCPDILCKLICNHVYKREGESRYISEISGAFGSLRTDLSWVRVLSDDEYKVVVEKREIQDLAKTILNTNEDINAWYSWFIEVAFLVIWTTKEQLF